MFTRPNQTPAATPEAPLSMDVGIFEMGSSLSLNDEVRRGVETETAHIEAENAKLEAKLQSEIKNGAELAKQQRHNHNEGVDTLQGASELSNSIGLSMEVLRGLNTTFESQLGGIMDGTHSSFHRHINVVPPSPAAAYNHTRSVPSFADHRELELERLEAEAKQIDANIKSTKQHTKDVVKQTRAVYASIKANRLQVTHANAKHQNNVLQTDIEDELKREKEWTAKVAEASAYVAELKARVPKLEDDLAAKKQANAAKEREAVNKGAELETRKQALRKEIRDIGDEIAVLNQQEAKFVKEINDTKELIAQRDQAIAQWQEARAGRLAIEGLKQDLEVTLAATQSHLNTVHSALEEEKKRAETIDDLEASNSKVNISELAKQLQGKQAKLDHLTSVLNDTSGPDNEELRNQLEAYKEELAELCRASSDLVEEKDSQTTEDREFERLSGAQKDDYQGQLQKIALLLEREAELESELNLKSEELDRSLEEKATKAEKDLREIQRKCKVLRFGSRSLVVIQAKEAEVASQE